MPLWRLTMKIDKKWSFLGGIVLGVLLGWIIIKPAINVLIAGNIYRLNQEPYYSEKKIKKMSYIINGFYVNSVDEEKLKEKIFTGYVYGIEDLDTKYLDKEAYKQYQFNREGKEIGVGITTTWGIYEQYLWVTAVQPNTPASRSKIGVGDKIIQIDGVRASGSNRLIMNEKLSPALGEKHIFTIEERETGQIKEIELEAEVLNIDSFTSDILENNIGYIKIKNILEHTAKELEKQLAEFEAKNINKVILDIRGVDSSDAQWTKEICDIFLDEGLCFSVMDNQGNQREYYTQNGKYEGEMVVLTDTLTEGTLEAFAAAIKDYKRGKLIGTITKGQPTIQTCFDLKDGTGVLISTGKLYTSKGIENKGVEPDIIVYTSYEEIISIIKNGTISIEQDRLIQAGIQQLTQKIGK